MQQVLRGLTAEPGAAGRCAWSRQVHCDTCACVACATRSCCCKQSLQRMTRERPKGCCIVYTTHLRSLPMETPSPIALCVCSLSTRYRARSSAISPVSGIRVCSRTKGPNKCVAAVGLAAGSRNVTRRNMSGRLPALPHKQHALAHPAHTAITSQPLHAVLGTQA